MWQQKTSTECINPGENGAMKFSVFQFSYVTQVPNQVGLHISTQLPNQVGLQIWSGPYMTEYYNFTS